MIQILFNAAFLHSVDVCAVFRRLQFSMRSVLNRLAPVVNDLSENNTLRCLFAALYNFHIRVAMLIVSQHHTKCIFFKAVICQTISGIRRTSSQNRSRSILDPVIQIRI